MQEADIPKTFISADNIPKTYLSSSNELEYKHYALSSGRTIGSGYIVKDALDSGAQASIYTVRREGKVSILKIFNIGYKPDLEIIDMLKNHQCPYLAKLIEYGYEQDNYYEIYEYYIKGTLEDKGKMPLSFIMDKIIPCVNKGLNFLHKLGGKGLIHGDIKPANLFLSDDESSVIIGDFGICACLSLNGSNVDEIKGTPEYALPTKGYFEMAIKKPSYDYGSFGLVIIKLATGFSLFGGLKISKIAAKCEEGLKIPKLNNSRLDRLISGLLTTEEQLRFGYEDVKEWCEGDYVNIKDKVFNWDDGRKKEPEPYLFGIIDQRVIMISSLKELTDQIASNWDHMKKVLQRKPFFEFLAQFDTPYNELEKDISEYAREQDGDIAVFKTLYRIDCRPSIIYRGEDYGTVEEFVQNLGGDISEDRQDFIKKGLLEYYLLCRGVQADLSDLRRLITREDVNPNLKGHILSNLYSGDKSITINKRKITNINDFCDEIFKLDFAAVEKLMHDNRVIAWLYGIGFGDEVLQVLKY